MDFKDLIGNNKIKDYLINSASNNQMLHSYMFSGREGIGKKLFAKIFAKMILCLSEDKPCNACKSCISFEGENHPDFMQINEENGKSIKIEQIRLMQEKVVEKPIISDKKVYIINDAELLTKEAQNCLLKTLEEPPEYVIIILIVSNESKILNTVKSRCVKIEFEKISDEEINNYLEKQGISKLSNIMLKQCDGSLKMALNIGEKTEEYNKQEELLDARMIALYKSGDTSYLEIFLTSSSMTDFLSKYYLAQELVECDKEFMQSVTEQKKELEAKKAELEADKKELDSSLNQQKAKQVTLTSMKEEKERYAAQLTEAEKKNQEEIEQFEKDKAEIEAQLKKIAEEEAKKNQANNIASTPSASGYIFPVQGLSKANINNKTYPSYPGHTGVDVNINVTGKNVVAVKAGTVVISTALRNPNGTYRSYGEYVVINHHDGTMTLYAHMLSGSRKVDPGDTVVQGQILGTVGSTGNSTGTHLHFEVKVNGRSVNPLPYLP